ncbi:MAG TPA: hypothetical protein VN719_09580 [Gemmatimonadales bacterium]|nr:hypothetical protein [Gemmatimonadales bacterium]
MDDPSVTWAAFGAGCVLILWGLECVHPFSDNLLERRFTGVILGVLGFALILSWATVPVPAKSPVRPVERSAGSPTSDRTSIGPSVSRRRSMYELEHQIDAHLGLTPCQRAASDGIRLAVATLVRVRTLTADPRFIVAAGYGYAAYRGEPSGRRADLKAATDTILAGWLS